MKNWKKIFVFISMAAFAFSLTACADSTENTEENVSESENVSNDNETQSTLIAYFSYTGIRKRSRSRLPSRPEGHSLRLRERLLMRMHQRRVRKKLIIIFIRRLRWI